MRNMDFGFSLSEESTEQMKGLICDYAQSLSDILNTFQEDLLAYAGKANYKKLVNAVDGIISLYDDTVRNDLKTGVLECWQDTCESMTSYASDMDMGEESEKAAAEVEEAFSEIFGISIENRLDEVRVDQRASASLVDFENVKDSFDEVVKKVEELTDDFLCETQTLGEENSFYQFMFPVVDAYGSGVKQFFEQARTKLDELQDNYVEKMASERSNVQENKKTLDLSSLLDFSDLVYDGMAGKKSKVPIRKEPDSEYAASDMAGSPNPQGNRYAKLISALTNFRGNSCPLVAYEKQLNADLNNFKQMLNAELNNKRLTLDQELAQYEEQLDRELKKQNRAVQFRRLVGLISTEQAQMLSSRNCTNTQRAYANYKRQIDSRYQAARNAASKRYEEKNRLVYQEIQKIKKEKQRCEQLYGKRQDFCKKLQKNIDCSQEIRAHIRGMHCTHMDMCPEIKAVLNALGLTPHQAAPFRHLFGVGGAAGLTQKYEFTRKLATELLKCKETGGTEGDLDSVFACHCVNNKAEQERLKKFVSNIEGFKDVPFSNKKLYEYIDRQYRLLNQTGQVNESLMDMVLSVLPWEMDEATRARYKKSYHDQKTTYASIKCDRYTNFDENYRDKLEMRKKNAIPKAKEVFERLSPELRIISDNLDPNDFTPFYSPSECGVYYNAQIDASGSSGRGAGTTFYHELGHMTDHKLAKHNKLTRATISEDPRFTAALNQDKALLIKNCKQDEYRTNFQKCLRQNLSHSLSDIVGGMKIHEVFGDTKQWGRFGHWPEEENGVIKDYWSTPFSLERETFAHMFEASMGAEKKKQLLQYFLPNTWSVFLSLLNQYGGCQ